MWDEIKKLHGMLEGAGIPHGFRDGFQEFGTAGGCQVLYYDDAGNRVCSAIQGLFSYGGDSGTIEIMGLLTEEENALDEVAGYLTADDVFGRISEHWKGHIIEGKDAADKECPNIDEEDYEK